MDLPIKRSLEKNRERNIKRYKEIYSWGWKLNEYEVKGIPLRLVVGQKEIENREVEEIAMVKNMVPQKGLEEIQKNMFQKALVQPKKILRKY